MVNENNEETLNHDATPEPTDEQLKEFLEKTHREYLDNLRKRIESFKKTMREDVKPSLLYDKFKVFTGEFDSLFSSASEKLIKSIAHKYANDLILGAFNNYKKDDIETRYYMEKFLNLMETFLHWSNTHSASKTLPGSLNIEQIIPVFFCNECNEKKQDFEKIFPDFQDRFRKNPK